jgi:hypothetical protein
MLGPRDNAGALEPFSHAAEEARLAAHLGVSRVVEGWLDTYALGVERRRIRHPDTNPLLLDSAYGVGTTEYMRSRGGYGVTLECGQHDDPEAPAVAYHAIRQTLALLKLIDAPLQAPTQGFEVLRLQDVIDLENVGDTFVREWQSFDPLRAGELIGHRHDGTAVMAPADGFIVFPNPRALPGNEWFYFARKSERTLT